MRKIYIVGTSHQNVTLAYKKELLELFDEINPDQVFIEKLKTELSQKRVRDDRPEMKIAYEWSLKNNKLVNAYDHKQSIIRSGIETPEIDKANTQLTKITKKIGWKDLNSLKNILVLKKVLATILDEDKFNQREQRMLQNINKAILSNGRILILCGTLHVPFFKSKFKEGILLNQLLK
jgi:hypothetical protein